MATRFPAVLFWLSVVLCLSAAIAWAAEPTRIAGPLDASGDFGLRKKARLAASGIACSGERCVIVFDEGRSARFARLTGSYYGAEPAPLVLRPGDPKDELDAEGAAIGGGKLYVTGSHAKARKENAGAAPDRDGKTCKSHPDARGLYRFALDATGLPASGAKAEEPTSGGLLGALKGTPLETAVDRCLMLGKGLNVEGLAFKNDKLFFGFRGPKPSTDFAYVASADAEALFGASPPQAAIFTVPVGDGRAIRDMQTVGDGFLLLIGPDDVEANGNKDYSLTHWTGADGAGAVDLGKIRTEGMKRPEGRGCDDTETKPEALAATETSDGWKVAILSDGMCDGGPMWFDVKRP